VEDERRVPVEDRPKPVLAVGATVGCSPVLDGGPVIAFGPVLDSGAVELAITLGAPEEEPMTEGAAAVLDGGSAGAVELEADGAMVEPEEAEVGVAELEAIGDAELEMAPVAAAVEDNRAAVETADDDKTAAEDDNTFALLDS
jgi:hypothetical protein